jgi:hypothetical protein
MFGISNWMRTLTSIPPWWESFQAALYVEMGDRDRWHPSAPHISALQRQQDQGTLMVLRARTIRVF